MARSTKKSTEKKKPKVNNIDRIPLELRIKHRFQPGKSGNPHGRPPTGKTITEHLRASIDKPAYPSIRAALARDLNIRPEDLGDITVGDAISMRASYQAALGEYGARDFFVNRTEGMLTSKVDVTSKDQQIQSSPAISVVSSNAEKVVNKIVTEGRLPEDA